jgi:hypothetical protein
MRAHGVTTFPDPLPSGGFDIPHGVKKEPQFQSAEQACRSGLPSGPSSSAKRTDIPAELNFAECMRSHGIAGFPDPNSQGQFDVPSDINTDSPRFETAAHACQTTGIHWNGA